MCVTITWIDNIVTDENLGDEPIMKLQDTLVPRLKALKALTDCLVMCKHCNLCKKRNLRELQNLRKLRKYQYVG